MIAVDRRTALRAGIGASAALATYPLIAAPMPLAERDPLEAIVRLRGNPAGPCWLWFEGTIYNQRPNEVIKPFCGFTSVLAVHYTRDGDDAYSFQQRESAHYTDLETGAVLTEITNPYSAKVNYAVGYVSPVFSYRITRDGVYSIRDMSRRGQFMPGLVNADGDLWLTEFRANSFPTGLPRKEFPESGDGAVRHSGDVATYRACADILASQSPGFVPAALSFTADTPWMQWMLMGDLPGQQMWVGQGSKVHSATDLTTAIRSRVEFLHPGFIADPFGIDGAPFGTLHQMRALRRAGRI